MSFRHLPVLARCLVPTFFFSAFILSACSGDIDSENESTPEQVEADGLVVDPPAAVTFADWQSPENCPAGTMLVIGKDECQGIGNACPEGEWAEDLPESDVLFVQLGGTGDGQSKESAMGSIGEAYEAALPGTTILVAKGLYDEELTLNKEITILGACSTETTIASTHMLRAGMSDSEMLEALDATIVIEGAGKKELRNIGVAGEKMGIAVVDAPGPVNIAGLLIDSTVGIGLTVYGASTVLDVSDFAVTNTRPTDVGQGGEAIVIQRGQVNLARGLVYRGHYIGIAMAYDESIVHAEDLIVRDIQPYTAALPEYEGTLGQGMVVGTGATFVGNRILIEDCRFVGLHALGVLENAPTLHVTDLIVRNTKPDPALESFYAWAGSQWGLGVQVWGGNVTLNRALLDGNTSAGIGAIEAPMPCTANLDFCADSNLVLRDITIVNTQPDEKGRYGAGMVLLDGATVDAERIYLANNHYAGIVMSDNFFSNDDQVTYVHARHTKVVGTMKLPHTLEGGDGKHAPTAGEWRCRARNTAACATAWRSLQN